MNINEISPISNSQPIKRTTPKKDVSTESNSVSDRVEISSEAKSLQNAQAIRKTALAALKDTPDTRNDKMNEIREKVQSGFYNTPQAINDIADRILNDII